jgi:hypothetical protein
VEVSLLATLSKATVVGRTPGHRLLAFTHQTEWDLPMA